MEKLLEFNDFHNEANIGLADIFTLNEDGYAAKYNKAEFRNFFKNSLNESEALDESLIEPSYAFYELSMLYESKSSWIETEGKFVYLDCDTHVLLVKNGEGHLIEKSTFDLIHSNINEGLWDSITSTWSALTSQAIADVKSVAKGVWDTISYGAKKAWEFAKTCANAITKFVKGMTFLDWVGVAISVLAAILGICGGIAFGTGVLAWLTPILNTIAGILMIAGGSLDLYEGYEKLNVANKVILGNPNITTAAKAVTVTAATLPDILIGGGMICMGASSIIQAFTSPVNPAAGTNDLIAKTSVKNTLKGAAKKVAKPGSSIEHLIEKAATKVFKGDLGKNVASKSITMITTMVGTTIISECIGGIWQLILTGIGGLASALDSIFSIPAKITSAIDNFSKSANNTITKILAKGLKAVVQPMTSAGAKVIEKYIKPIIDGVKKWINEQVVYYKKSKDLIKEYKESIHGEVEQHKPNPKTDPGKEWRDKMDIKKIDAKSVKKKDLTIIRKAQDKQKVKESLSYNMIHIKPFII